MIVHQPWALLLLPVVLVPLWLNSRAGQVYSSLTMVPEDRFSDFMGWVLRYLVAVILAFLVLALAQVEVEGEDIVKTGKGAQVVLVIDRSASMDDPFAGAGTQGRVGENKSAAARRLITQFVGDRKDDMVGVIAFSNSAMQAIPLTQSREAIYAAINAAGGSGLLQTNIGAGLTRGLALFDKMPDSGSRAVILLSDGAGRISPKAKQKIADWLMRERVNLYWIVLRQPNGISIFNNDYELDSDGLEPAEIELHKFFQALKTQYKAYEAEDPRTLQQAIQDINVREKHTIRYTEKLPGKDLSNLFVGLAAGLILLLLCIRQMGVQSWQQA